MKKNNFINAILFFLTFAVICYADSLNQRCDNRENEAKYNSACMSDSFSSMFKKNMDDAFLNDQDWMRKDNYPRKNVFSKFNFRFGEVYEKQGTFSSEFLSNVYQRKHNSQIDFSSLDLNTKSSSKSDSFFRFTVFHENPYIR